MQHPRPLYVVSDREPWMVYSIIYYLRQKFQAFQLLVLLESDQVLPIGFDAKTIFQIGDDLFQPRMIWQTSVFPQHCDGRTQFLNFIYGKFILENREIRILISIITFPPLQRIGHDRSIVSNPVTHILDIFPYLSQAYLCTI